jgi:hypothetical protein
LHLKEWIAGEFDTARFSEEDANPASERLKA